MSCIARPVSKKKKKTKENIPENLREMEGWNLLLLLQLLKLILKLW
jgi:hypothetical protein